MRASRQRRQAPSPKSSSTSAASRPAPRYLVGIGASAGGLEALRSLFAGLKKSQFLSFVVVQHLAPQHRSRLVELIAHSTSLKVKEIEEGEKPAAGIVYVTPPNSDVVMQEGALSLRAPETKIGPKPSVDLFFRTLAEEQRECAIGIVLSGTGSDGSQGIREVKAAGGITFCQHLKTAKYDGMPRAAKQTGCIDYELDAEEIATRLRHLDDLAARSPDPLTSPDLDEEGRATDPFHSILLLVKRESKVDFSQYKLSTLRRRIDRRVVATRSKSLKQYSQFLKRHPEEARFLFQDILISVTAFFRDEENFKAFGDYLVGRVKRKEPGQPLRVWVVGCATGEEAYSVAILLHESMERAKKTLQLQVFATDLDEQSMVLARKGVYPKESLAGVARERLVKYFDTTDGVTVRVKDFIRESIVFARHDATLDPPFLKLDAVTCRNVLIYFNSKLQEQVLRTFHYALDTGGLLFLGKSEAVGSVGGLFTSLDKNAKIFARAGHRGDLPRTYNRTEFTRETQLLTKDRETTTGLELFQGMLLHFAPDAVLVDNTGRIKHIYGNASQYLNLPKGAPTVSIAKLIPDSLAAELTALIHRATKTQRMSKSVQKHSFKRGGSKIALQLWVAPLVQEGRQELLVCFQSVAPDLRSEVLPPEIAKLPDSDKVKRLQKELGAAKDHLQTVIEEQETANEELQALNEELQSSNEELQSTNEELETTNEELETTNEEMQSANEELTTLNQEVNVKAQELIALNQRLQAVQSAISYPLLVVDSRLRLLEFNPASRFLFRLTDADKGVSIRTFAERTELVPAIRLTEEALAKGKDRQTQFQAAGRDYEVRVQIVRGYRDEAEGAVVTFVDNSELVSALSLSKLHQRRLDDILNHTPAMVTMKDTQGIYVYANRRFCEFFGLAPEEVMGRTDEDILPEDASERMRGQDYDVMKTRKAMRFENSFAWQGKDYSWLSSKFPLVDASKRVQSICSISFDITDRVLQEKQLELFKRVVSASNVGLVLFARQGEEFFSTHVSEEFASKIGVSPSRLMGKTDREILSGLLGQGKQGAIDQAVNAVKDRAVSSISLQIAADESGERWVDLKSSVIELTPSGDRHLVYMLFDQSDQMKLRRELRNQEEELSHFSRLASLGEVAAGLSHELNTPLNVISAKADLLERLAERDLLERAKIKKASTEIEQMVKNITAIISGLKTLSGLQTLSGLENLQKGPNDLEALIKEAVKICEFKIKRFGVSVDVQLPPSMVVIECYGIQIVQILINLITNSVDAIHASPEKWIRIELSNDANRVRIRVTDSGPGIAPALAEKIMAPFFTTKKDKKGTGLGLSLSRTIARKHGGDLALVPGSKNTCFLLELPLQPNG